MQCLAMLLYNVNAAQYLSSTIKWCAPRCSWSLQLLLYRPRSIC